MTTALPPHRPALLAAAVLLGAALQRANGFYEPVALALLLAALVCAWAALLFPRVLRGFVPDRDDLVRAFATAALLAQTAVILRSPIGFYFERPLPEQHPGFVLGLGAAAAAALAAFLNHRVLRRSAAVTLLGAAGLLGALTYRGSPTPAIDVVTVHHEAYAAMARGDSPFSMTFPDLYGGREAFYPPGMVVEGRVHYGFPYPPLSLAMAWPGHLAGDFRWSELAAWLVAAAAVLAAARASAVAVLAVAVWLFTPRAFFALEQAWTEPLALAWIGVAVWAGARGHVFRAAVCVGLAAATKQYLVLAIPFLFLLEDRRAMRRVPLVLVALGAGAAVTMPGLVADPSGFVASVIGVQIREVLRYDALSLAVTYAQWAGAPMPGAIYGAIVIAAMVLAGWRAPRNLGGFTAALAVTLFTTFVFGKKAFCNYYVCVIALLAMAIATAQRGGDAPDLAGDGRDPAGAPAETSGGAVLRPR